MVKSFLCDCVLIGSRPQANQNLLQEVQEAHRPQGLAVQEG